MRRFIKVALLLSLVLVPLRALASGPSFEPAGQSGSVVAIMANMTPAEKVGQLFLVTFYGASAEPGSDIERLITQYHVGGVMLMASHDNITDTVNAPTQVLTLTNQLQAAAIATSQAPRSVGAGLPPFIPLLIAINHSDESEIRSGLTEMPSEMAIGATWDPRQAEALGRLAGAELAALGVNLLLGPSLDVLENPRPQGPGDLGTRVFGGDPFWVGMMGQAYIRGVHQGAQGQVGVVATHFPGIGSSDRNLEGNEIPAVRKSLEDLLRIDLPPFIAVTGHAPNPASTTDALLSAHIRFQGLLQNNIRQNTQPISFDPQVLETLLKQPGLDEWRARGGVIVSDSLGAPAIKRFYDLQLQTFKNRQIAREAFAAGNDLLLLSEFGLNPRTEQTDYIIDTLRFFAQQYNVDPAFAEKVDAAVERILMLKMRLYGGRFDPASRSTQRPLEGLSRLNQGEGHMLLLAQAAATLLGLTPEELVARAPEVPIPNDHLLFFTDARLGTRQCGGCPAVPLLDRRELERAVLQFYGPEGSRQVRTGNLQSFSFEDLAEYLSDSDPSPASEGTATPEPSPLEAALAQADWIIFGMLNVTPDVPASGVVSNFLTQHPEMARDKKIVVFALGAPYYL
ncbi:MAG: glycoside hydrolase family 3 N-terminal domain-containing protein, partial [Anaerolineales bacterium]